MSDKIIEVDYRQNPEKKLTARWWTVEENVHEHLFPLVQSIEQRQGAIRTQNLRHARLYSNLEIYGLQMGLFSRANTQAVVNNRVTFNVVKSCIDTAASKIAKMRPRPMFLTIGGDEGLQRQAKNLTLFMDGAFEAGKVYASMQRGFVDAGVFGTGATKFYKEGRKVMTERVLIDEIIVDETEAMYGEPLTLYQTKFINRDTLCEMFPAFKTQIMDAAVGVTADWVTDKTFDRIRVVEAWKRPSYVGAKDGRHCIVISNATLENKKYTKDYFPFVFQRWNYKLTGFFGCGLAEELVGNQLEINKLLRTVQLAMHYCAVPRVFVDVTSNINTAHINNDVGGIVKFQGNPPIFNTSPVMPAEVYAHIENLVKKAYEISGISLLSAQSKKPSGLDSGAALREYQDIESERFQLVGQRYEDAHMEASKIIFDMYKDMGGNDIEMTAEDGKYVRKIKWDEVDLDLNQCVLRVFPTSILPTQPAGKLQKVQELMQAGLLDRETGLKLLDFPDLEGSMTIRLAAVKNAEAVVAKILEDGEAVQPEPYMNLDYAKAYAQNAYLDAQIRNVSEDKLELLRQFITNCDSLKHQATPQPQSPVPGAEAGGAPMAQPMAPPVSDLVQNVPPQG